MSFELIIADIDAGGASIDLSFDSDSMEVKEVKTFDNGSVTTMNFDIEDFDEDNYGKSGEDFLDKIGI